MSNQSQNMQLNIKYGPLAKSYKLFIPTTIQTGAQISVDRMTDDSLNKIWFYTANVSLATKRDGKLLLGIGNNIAFNAVFGANTEEVCNKLFNKHYIHLKPNARDIILGLEKAGEVEFVDPKNLGLKGEDSYYGENERYFPVRTNKYEKDVTASRVPFVKAGYGSGYMLRGVMKNLKVKGKLNEMLVITMNPKYVASHVEDNEIIALACGLSNFGVACMFRTNSWYNTNSSGAMRGVLLNSTEGGGTQKSHLENLVEKNEG